MNDFKARNTAFSSRMLCGAWIPPDSTDHWLFDVSREHPNLLGNHLLTGDYVPSGVMNSPSNLKVWSTSENDS